MIGNASTRKMKSLMNTKRLQQSVLIIMIVIGAIIMAFPFIWMVLTSLKHSDEIYRLPVTILPDDFLNFENYVTVFERQPFLRFFLNSFIVASSSTMVTLFFSSLAGYAFAKFEFPGKEVLFFVFILAALMIPFEIIVIPLYLLFNRLGLVNTYLGIMGPAMLSAFGIFIMRQFIVSIPNDYLDAARIDGLSEFQIFLRIIIPLSVPALATLGTIKFIWTWNEFLWPLVMVTSEKMRTVTLGLSTYTGMWHTDYTIITAAAFLSVIPMLIIYLFLQNFVIEGMTMTGVKG
ncbi:MAG: carbohydrate ABC transporter permease [Chloroflexota bacterium]|nr:carbohydrate ABC transporter permease [Chloroflexota bacterium]